MPDCGPEAYSLSGARRAFNYDFSEAIRAGKLRASRPGKRKFIILRRDIEDFLASCAIRPTGDAEALAARRLEREARV